ncbi:MAG TPA: FAD-dependent monooxygenase [Rhabdochlamydiaceae bacterium]|jgi:2-polyprenyl-6-methoxyphenol hydroxylase-like FAD-dependent oxidoreductase
MHDQRLSILIIGAGLGGLALAQGLATAGFNVTVFERDKSPTSRAQGYRISIRSLGKTALSVLLTPEKMSRLSSAKIADVGDGFTCANEKMQPIFTISQGQDAAVQLLRFELRSLLQEGINIEWNKRLIKFEDKGDQVIAHFEDGSYAAGDFLVGCDGGASTVRELLPSVYGNRLGSIPEVIDSNRVVLAGQIDRTVKWDRLLPLNKNGLVRFVGPNSHSFGVCFSERADRSPTVFWALSEEIKNRDATWYQFDQGLECCKQILDHCKQLMKNESWHENLKKLVFDTPAEAMMTPWLLRTTQFPDAKQFPMVPSGRVTLIGDSAHAMPPDKGLGGNNVLEDARLLSTLLTSSPKPIDWLSLTEEFERQMFARARKAVQESNSAAESFRTIRSLSESK